MASVWRIRDRRTFDQLRSATQRARSGPIAIARVPDTATPPRIGFAIPKRVGSAVVRNRVRRRLRGILADHDLPGGAYLVQVAPAAARMNASELREACDAAMRRLGRGPS